MEDSNRFYIKEEQTIGTVEIKIIVDSETGINYLMTNTGVTPLLDEAGQVEYDYAE